MIGEYKFKPMNMKGTESLKTIRKNNTNWIVYAHLIITSLRNKSDSLGNVDILMFSEKMFNSSFPTGQFIING